MADRMKRVASQWLLRSGIGDVVTVAMGSGNSHAVLPLETVG